MFYRLGSLLERNCFETYESLPKDAPTLRLKGEIFTVVNLM